MTWGLYQPVFLFGTRFTTTTALARGRLVTGTPQSPVNEISAAVAAECVCTRAARTRITTRCTLHAMERLPLTTTPSGCIL